MNGYDEGWSEEPYRNYSTHFASLTVQLLFFRQRWFKLHNLRGSALSRESCCRMDRLIASTWIPVLHTASLATHYLLLPQIFPDILFHTVRQALPLTHTTRRFHPLSAFLFVFFLTWYFFQHYLYICVRACVCMHDIQYIWRYLSIQ